MKKKYVLYNPVAGNGKGKEGAEELKTRFDEQSLVYVDVTTVNDYAEFFAGLSEEDEVIVCGGDGTLNRFVNQTAGVAINNKLYYYACGSGNDFLRDMKDPNEKLVELNEFIENLPVANVNGKEYRFLNNVGFGIDGYCCEMGDKLRGQSDKPVNYTGIAIKGLLFHYKPTNATVIMDGKEYFFKKVWLAPTMNGRFYGGGMMATPDQDRTGDTLSVMLFHGSGRLKTLMIFPSIFKGEHVKKVKNVTVLTGKEITVKFDGPRAVQVDGETVLGITEYTAKK